MATGKRGWLKLLGMVVGGLAGVIVLAFIVLVVATNRMIAAKVTVPVAVEAIPIPEGDATSVARGQYLVDHVIGCKICHGPDFGGGTPIHDAMIGTLWAPNLTSGAGSVTRDMTVADWLRAMRHGVAKDGHRLLLMPSDDMVNFDDEDIGAIIAYVKSLPPVDRADRGIHPGPVGRALVAAGQMQFAYEKIDHTRTRPVAVPAPTAEWGLILSGTCSGCHGTGFSGGRIPGGDPAWPPARNLTPHETGLKGWTFEQFSNALRHGRRPDGTTLATVMPWQSFAGMTDTDARALFAFLQMQTPKPAGGR